MQSRREISERIDELFSTDALQAWVLYPDQRKIAVHKPDGSARSYSGRFTSLLPGVEIDLEAILGQ